MASKKVTDAASAKERSREDILSEQNNRLLRVLSELESEVIALAGELTVSGGLVVNDQANLAIASNARANLVEIFEREYTEQFVVPSIREYDEIAVDIKAYLERVGITANFTQLDKDVMDTLKVAAFTGFNNLGLNFQNTLATEMYTSVLSNREFSVMVKNLKGALTGIDDVRGVPMEVHAKTIAHDSLLTFDRSLTTKKAEDAGIQNYLYHGSRVANSRSICKREAGRTRPLEQWQELWDSEDWSGKKSSNFLIDAGGWNCGHVPVPVP
jgi:hypothetical protein